jgi:hypothetical protein
MTLDEALRQGLVLIKYKSLNSGREIEGVFTTQDRYPYVANNPMSDKVIAYNMSSNPEYIEDIERKTIIEWKIVDE